MAVLCGTHPELSTAWLDDGSGSPDVVARAAEQEQSKAAEQERQHSKASAQQAEPCAAAAAESPASGGDCSTSAASGTAAAPGPGTSEASDGALCCGGAVGAGEEVCGAGLCCDVQEAAVLAEHTAALRRALVATEAVRLQFWRVLLDVALRDRRS